MYVVPPGHQQWSWEQRGVVSIMKEKTTPTLEDPQHLKEEEVSRAFVAYGASEQKYSTKKNTKIQKNTKKIKIQKKTYSNEYSTKYSNNLKKEEEEKETLLYVCDSVAVDSGEDGCDPNWKEVAETYPESVFFHPWGAGDWTCDEVAEAYPKPLFFHPKDCTWSQYPPPPETETWTRRKHRMKVKKVKKIKKMSNYYRKCLFTGSTLLGRGRVED